MCAKRWKAEAAHDEDDVRGGYSLPSFSRSQAMKTPDHYNQSYFKRMDARTELKADAAIALGCLLYMIALCLL